WNNGVSGDQYLVAVATEDDTEVTVTLVHPGAVTLAGAGVPALDFDDGPASTTVTLDRLDVLTIFTDLASGPPLVELTGTRVDPPHPIAVYSGNPPTYLPGDGCCADVVVTAVPPTTLIGDSYAAVKFVPRNDEPDVWRFIADEDDTTITLSGGVAPDI